MSYQYNLDRVVPNVTLSSKEMVMFCSGCFASLSQYEMLMCKICRRIYCRHCTNIDFARIQTQLDGCAICHKRKPHPESVLCFALMVAGENEDLIKRIRRATRDVSIDSVEDLLRRVCEITQKSYAQLQKEYGTWRKKPIVLPATTFSEEHLN